MRITKTVAAIVATIVAAGAVVTLSVAAAPKKAGGGTEVTVVGIAVGKPNVSDTYADLMGLTLRPGTAVYFRIIRKDKVLIFVDETASKLASFTDDKGTVLAKPGSVDRLKNWWLGAFSEISEDGHVYHFSIVSDTKTPAPGARTLQAKAVIVLFCGSDEKTEKQKDVALKVNTKITVGPIQMTISKIWQEERGDEKLTAVTLESDKRFYPIRKLEFLGPDGKAIETLNLGEGSTSMGGKLTYDRTFGLKSQVDKVTVRITYFAKTEKLTVPVDVNVGVGF